MRVLIVDDDAVMRELAAFVLGLDREIEVVEASSGDAALALIESGTCRPDLVLLDKQMPGLDGPATLARLPAGLPVAFLTAAGEDAQYLLELGARAVIAKPIDPACFANTVKSIITHAG